jgi:hypothetical protein
LTLFVLATLSKATMAFTGGMRIVNFFQMQLSETALFACHLHCHSVNKPHNQGSTKFPLPERPS